MLFLLADHLQVWSQLHNWIFVYSLEETSYFMDLEDWIPLKKIKDTEDPDTCEKKSYYRFGQCDRIV